MKIGILVTARMGSSRLPDKHLRPIQDRPALSYMLDRIIAEFRPELQAGDAVALIATGGEARNGPLRSLTGDAVGIFFGDDENVPKRHLQCAESLALDALLPIDGDDLFVAPEAMRSVWNRLRAGAELAKTAGLPLGMNAWGYGTQTLRSALAQTAASLLETGWGRIFDHTRAIEDVIACPDAERVRATLDYEQDLAFFTSAMTRIPEWQGMPSVEFVRRVVDLGINELNFGMNEEYWRNFSRNIEHEQQRGQSWTSASDSTQ